MYKMILSIFGRWWLLLSALAADSSPGSSREGRAIAGVASPRAVGAGPRSSPYGRSGRFAFTGTLGRHPAEDFELSGKGGSRRSSLARCGDTVQSSLPRPASVQTSCTVRVRTPLLAAHRHAAAMNRLRRSSRACLRLSAQEDVDLGLSMLLPPDRLPGGRVPAAASVELASDAGERVRHGAARRRRLYEGTGLSFGMGGLAG